jgi:hypothetical protein
MKYIKTYNESREELTSEEGKEFLDIVRQKLPEKVNRYMSLIVNKGLDVAIQDFKINDPDEIKRREKERIKDEKNDYLRNKKSSRLRNYDFGYLIAKYFLTKDWNEWINKYNYPNIEFTSSIKLNPKISLKKEEYEVSYKSEEDIFKKNVSKYNLEFIVTKTDDKTIIKGSYVVRYQFDARFSCSLLNTDMKIEYDNTDIKNNNIKIEENFTNFLKEFKQHIFSSDPIKSGDETKVKEFTEILKQQPYVTVFNSKNDKGYYNYFTNDEFSFLREIPFTEYQYDKDYIYLKILNKYFFKFHEQYANKVYKLYKKAS